MIGLVLAGLLAGAVLIQMAISRPWLALAFTADDSGIIHVTPASGVDGSAIVSGPIAAIRGSDGRRVAIEAGDLIEEPDTLATYAEMRRFFARQSMLEGVVSGRSVSIETAGARPAQQTTLAPARMRPISDLPAAFWVQMLVGLASFLIGGWVWALRRSDTAARLFALASLGILVFTFPAALYSTRELAIDGDLFRALSVMNHGGALLFGAAMIALLLRYPRPLVPARWLWAPFALFGAWWLGDSLQVFDGHADVDQEEEGKGITLRQARRQPDQAGRNDREDECPCPDRNRQAKPAHYRPRRRITARAPILSRRCKKDAEHLQHRWQVRTGRGAIEHLQAVTQPPCPEQRERRP